jgi:hypothetical protein
MCINYYNLKGAIMEKTHIKLHITQYLELRMNFFNSVPNTILNTVFSDPLSLCFCLT